MELAKTSMHFHNLNQGLTYVSKTFGPDDEPMAIRILESGWHGLYHVLVEFGDYEQTDYHHLDIEQILGKFGIDLRQLENEIIVCADDIARNPNDQDLGGEIRKRFFAENPNLHIKL